MTSVKRAWERRGERKWFSVDGLYMIVAIPAIPGRRYAYVRRDGMWACIGELNDLTGAKRFVNRHRKTGYEQER